MKNVAELISMIAEAKIGRLILNKSGCFLK